jgi:peptide-methionine (R)-S-oxide reductase
MSNQCSSPNPNADDRPLQTERRGFLMASSLGVASLALGVFRARAGTSTGAKTGAKVVRIVEFASDGRRLRVADLPKVMRSDAEWRKRLSPLAFDVTRRAGTERPYTGALLKNKAAGVYRCACCATALFDAKTKYDSQTGWPSFWQPIAREILNRPRATAAAFDHIAVNRSFRRRSGPRRGSGGRRERQRHRIHAVAQTRRLRAVVENMPQMRIAARADYFGAYHEQRAVLVFGDVLARDRLPKAGPTGL